MTGSAAHRLGLMSLLLLGSGGCGGSLASTTDVHFGSPMGGRDPQPSTVQLAPTARWRSRRGPLAASATYAPTVTMEPGAPLQTRHRLGAEAGAGRVAGLRPYARLNLEYGTVRPGDLPAEELLELQPGIRLLRSYAARGEGGLRGRLSRRTELRAGVSAERSAGIGASAATLPTLTRTSLFVRGLRQRTRAQLWDGGVRISRYDLDGSAFMLETDVRATIRLSERLSVAATVGGASTRSAESAEVRPIVGFVATFDAGDSRRSDARLSVATRPDFDRLDGGLRQRLLVQAVLGSEPQRGLRLGIMVSWASDVGGIGPLRRTLTAQGTVGVELTPDWDAVLGARAFVHGGPGASGARNRSEARLQLSLSRRLNLR